MRRKMRGSLLLVAALVTTMFVVPAKPASADPLPPTHYTPIPITDMSGPNHLISQPDGGVTLGCSGGTTGTKRISATGTVTQNIASGTAPYPNTCGRNAAVGQDGTLFTVATAWNGWPTIQAIKNSSVLWTHSFSCLPSVRGMVVGTNGNLYVLTTGLVSPCGGQSSVTGFTPGGSGGAPNIVFNQQVASNVVEGGIAAYDGGLVIRTETGLQYATYGGSVGSASTITGLLGNPGTLHHDTTLNGRMPVAVRANSTSVQFCGNDQDTVGGIHAFEASGQQWVYNSLPACSHVTTLRPTPSGGAVVLYNAPQAGVPGNPRNEFLLAIDGGGDLLWQYPLAVASGEQHYATTYVIDLNGNVAIHRWIRYVLNSGGSTYYFHAQRFLLLSGFSGGVVATREISGDHSTSSGTGYRPYGSSDISVGPNTWFVPAMECDAWSCNSASAKLYAVTVPGLEMDYPRGAIVSPAVTPLDYVAMGDSFSSGEGVPDFESGTDTAGLPENRCHRSERAYSRLLATSPSLHLNLTGFVARHPVCEYGFGDSHNRR